MLGDGLMLTHKRFLVVSLTLLLGLLLVFVVGKPASGADTLPSGFTQESFATGLVAPTAMAFAPDGRLFVAEQGGTLQVVDENGGLQTPPFLDISSKVSSVGERGLLGVAFDPDFGVPGNNFVYVYYTHEEVGTTPPYNLVARFPTSVDGNGNVVAGSEETIFQLPPWERPTTTVGLYTSATTASSTWGWARTPGQPRPSP